jgi:hypothetical protein
VRLHAGRSGTRHQAHGIRHTASGTRRQAHGTRHTAPYIGIGQERDMTIEIKKRPGNEFAEDTVNAASQYKYFMKKPERKLQNYFKQWKALLIVSIVWVILMVAVMVLFGADAIMEVCLAVLLMNIVFCAAMLLNIVKYKKQIMEDERLSYLTIDENGVELMKDGVQTVRVAWSNVAFIRIFDAAICFFPKNLTSFVISVDKDYSGQILDEINRLGADVKVI